MSLHCIHVLRRWFEAMDEYKTVFAATLTNIFGKIFDNDPCRIWAEIFPEYLKLVHGIVL